MIWSRWSRPALPVVVVAGLLCLGAANIAARATWHEVEDGVLWKQHPEGIVAAEVAPGTPAAAVGILRGDLLLSIDDRPVQVAIVGGRRARRRLDRLEQVVEAVRQRRDLGLLQPNADHRAALAGLEVERPIAGLADGPGDESVRVVEDEETACHRPHPTPTGTARMGPQMGTRARRRAEGRRECGND